MDKVDELLTRIVTNIIPSKEKLKKSLRGGKKLNIYFGIDPTTTRIHLGNAVPLRKLQKFVEEGHNVAFLIGDFTALIGDTSDKESERPILTKEQIRENFKQYKNQASKILDFSKVKVHYNSEWLSKLSFEEIVKLCQNFTLGDFISRELIRKRIQAGTKVRLDEVLYPVMQGYDSYYMDTDIQIGGTDQTFNMQAGRTLQKRLRNKESYIMVTKFPLMGTDGRKMSKSWGNAIWLGDIPDDMYGKIMSINDDLIVQYLELATNLPMDQVKEEAIAVKKGENPINIKRRLAFQIVKEMHSEKDAQKAQEAFEKTFQGNKPEFRQELEAKETLAETVSQVVGSMSEAKRLIAQEAVEINNLVVTNPTMKIRGDEEIKVGKKIFIKIKKDL